MSFTREKRAAVWNYIMEKLDAGDTDLVRKTAENYGMSDKTVYRYLREMAMQGVIEKEGKAYRLKTEEHVFTLHRADLESSDEDRVYREYIREHTDGFRKNVSDIWYYAFTGMMNNAMDHSGAETIRIKLVMTGLHTTVVIWDNGIGIFKNIKDHFHYDSLDDAVEDLFKGKVTTDPEHHSGEGIFFTSRMMDLFAVISNGKMFAHDKYQKLLHDLQEPLRISSTDALPGTYVFMRLSNFSKKNETEIFDSYADPDGGFTRTQVPLKEFFDTWPVSRSQAKRLCRGFERFSEVELDFSGVEKIGQGFAHELFVVWQNAHPSVKLIAAGENETVKRMIRHVTSGEAGKQEISEGMERQEISGEKRKS